MQPRVVVESKGEIESSSSDELNNRNECTHNDSSEGYCMNKDDKTRENCNSGSNKGQGVTAKIRPLNPSILYLVFPI